MNDKNRNRIKELKNFRDLIDKSGKTREEIADALHCDVSLITKHYNGQRNFTLDYAIKYAEYFGVTVDYIIGMPYATEDMLETDVQACSTLTGLTQEAINLLKIFNNIRQEEIDVISALIKDNFDYEDGFIKLITQYLHVNENKSKSFYLLPDGTIRQISPCSSDDDFSGSIKLIENFGFRFSSNDVIEKHLLDRIIDRLHEIKKEEEFTSDLDYETLLEIVERTEAEAKLLSLRAEDYENAESRYKILKEKKAQGETLSKEELAEYSSLSSIYEEGENNG